MTHAVPWLMVVAALWMLTEWLRGTLFTGFPWLALGYSQAPLSPLAGLWNFANISFERGTFISVAGAGCTKVGLFIATRHYLAGWLQSTTNQLEQT